MAGMELTLPTLSLSLLHIASSELKSIFSLKERVCLICVSLCLDVCVSRGGSCLCPPERVHGALHGEASCTLIMATFAVLPRDGFFSLTELMVLQYLLYGEVKTYMDLHHFCCCALNYFHLHPSPCPLSSSRLSLLSWISIRTAANSSCTSVTWLHCVKRETQSFCRTSLHLPPITALTPPPGTHSCAAWHRNRWVCVSGGQWC